MQFEVSKSYRHSTGNEIHILCEVDTSAAYGRCFLAEDKEGNIIPLGIEECNDEGYSEIPFSDFLNNFGKEEVETVECEVYDAEPVEETVKESIETKNISCEHDDKWGDITFTKGSFAWAIELAKYGYSVKRRGWSNYVKLYPGCDEKLGLDYKPVKDCLCITTDDGYYQPGWTPSTDDIFSEDWEEC